MEDKREEVFEQEEPAAGEEQETEDTVTEEESVPDEEGMDEEPVQTEEEEEVPDPREEDEEKKHGFFGKRKKDKRDTQIEELTDRVKRQMAEFDNYRKRTEKEKASMFEAGEQNVLEKILPILDSFERGLAAIAEEDRDDPVAQGMDKIYRQLLATFENIGVKPIEAKGQPFDPNFHNAVMHVEDEELGENIVAEEFQKGYMFHDSVLRHSMVKVAN